MGMTSFGGNDGYLLLLLRQPGGEGQAARQSVHQKKQVGHPLSDGDPHHLCGEWRWNAQWNMGKLPIDAWKGIRVSPIYFNDKIISWVFFTLHLQAETLHVFLSYQVLHSLVCSVEKQATTPSGSPLLIHCKNFQVLHFVIPQERECHDVHVSLLRLSQPGKLLVIAATKHERTTELENKTKHLTWSTQGTVNDLKYRGPSLFAGERDQR